MRQLKYIACFIWFLPGILTAQIVTTFAGNGLFAFNGDGIAATAANIGQMANVCLDSKGNVYFSNGISRIRKVNIAGIISTIAGGDSIGFSGDGGQATAARIRNPSQMCLDRFDNIFFVDGGVRIRKIDTNGMISTYAGTGVIGASGNGGPATSANITPGSVTVDTSGDIYLADSTVYLRKIERSSGIITSIAGNGTHGYSGDGGPATAAAFAPSGVYADGSGNIFVCEAFNSRIRRIDKFGMVSTIAGNGTAASSGDGGPATAAMVRYPGSITGDALGNIYFCEPPLARVRRITAGGRVERIAGSDSTPGYGGDGGPATAAKFGTITGLAVDPAMNYLYISDFGNMRVRRMSFPVTEVPAVGISVDVVITPNPASTEIIVQHAAQGMAAVYDLAGREVLRKTHLSCKERISIENLPDGYYIVHVFDEQGNKVKVQRILKE